MVVQLYIDEFIFREALQRMHVEKLKRMSSLNFFENPLGIHSLFRSFDFTSFVFFCVIKKFIPSNMHRMHLHIHIHKKILYGKI